MSDDSLNNRNLRFREQYRNAISPHYRYWLHTSFVFGGGSALIIFCFSHITQVSVSTIIWAVLALLTMNVGEYVAHRYLGHKKRKLAKLFYQRHTGDHHSFFSHINYQIESLQDLRVVLFPAFLLVAVTLLVALPFGKLISLGFGSDAGWSYAGALLSGYIFYEVVHLIDHLPEQNPFTRLPLFKQFREHHRQHHHPDIALIKNFNVTFPLMDYLLGSKYKPSKSNDT